MTAACLSSFITGGAVLQAGGRSAKLARNNAGDGGDAMPQNQQESAGLYAQCIAVWLTGAVVFVLMRALASSILSGDELREFTMRTASLYVGALLLAGVAFNVTLFIVARFSPVVRGFEFLPFNAAVFMATALLVSLFFVMSRTIYRSDVPLSDPGTVYPFVALIVVLTATILMVSWVYYQAEFAVADTAGRFWFSFVTLTVCLFFFMYLLVFFNAGSRLDRFDPYAFSVNVALGLGWTIVHAAVVRLVWTPLAGKKSAA